MYASSTTIPPHDSSASTPMTISAQPHHGTPRLGCGGNGPGGTIGGGPYPGVYWLITRSSRSIHCSTHASDHFTSPPTIVCLARAFTCQPWNGQLRLKLLN